MKYTLTRIDPDAPVERYPQEQIQTVDDPLAQDATRGIMMGRLEEVLQDTVNVSIHRNSIDTGKMRRSSLDPTFLLA